MNGNCVQKYFLPKILVIKIPYFLERDYDFLMPAIRITPFIRYTCISTLNLGMVYLHGNENTMWHSKSIFKHFTPEQSEISTVETYKRQLIVVRFSSDMVCNGALE